MKLDKVYFGTLATYVNNKVEKVDTKQVLVYLNYLKHYIDIENGERYVNVDNIETRPVRGISAKELTRVDMLTAEEHEIAEVVKKYVKIKSIKTRWHMK